MTRSNSGGEGEAVYWRSARVMRYSHFPLFFFFVFWRRSKFLTTLPSRMITRHIIIARSCPSRLFHRTTRRTVLTDNLRLTEVDPAGIRYIPAAIINSRRCVFRRSKEREMHHGTWNGAWRNRRNLLSRPHKSTRASLKLSDPRNELPNRPIGIERRRFSPLFVI